MPTSKHWVIPNTIPYASPSLKMLYSVTNQSSKKETVRFDMYSNTGHPVWGHITLSCLFLYLMKLLRMPI